MMTMAGPPRATPEKSMAALQKAWERMRAWLYKRWRKAFTFVLVIEVGKRNGLIHMHCLAKFPGFVNYADAGAQWERAYPGAVCGGLHFSSREHGESGKKTTIFNAKSGAYYLAKYATKGIELLDLPPETAARTLAAMTGKRIVRASKGFWTPPDCRCEDCGWKYGLATGHRAIEFAISLYAKFKSKPAGPLATDADSAAREHAARARARGQPAAIDWARGIASPELLVAVEGKILDRMAPGHRQTGLAWN
jgi:hypothetical protein